jgi:hypothetical protein
MSDGSISPGESSHAIAAAVDRLRARSEVDPECIGGFGVSIAIV